MEYPCSKHSRQKWPGRKLNLVRPLWILLFPAFTGILASIFLGLCTIAPVRCSRITGLAAVFNTWEGNQHLERELASGSRFISGYKSGSESSGSDGGELLEDEWGVQKQEIEGQEQSDLAAQDKVGRASQAATQGASVPSREGVGLQQQETEGESQGSIDLAVEELVEGTEGVNLTDGGGVGQLSEYEGPDQDDKSENEGPNKDSKSSGQCPLGLIYVYDLPPMFNREIIDGCKAQCEKLLHHALGVPVDSTSNSTELEHLKAQFGDPSAWFNTHMSSLEPTYHARMLQHPCRTEDAEQASVFYLPFYTALALERVYTHRNHTLSNHLPIEFVKWLRNQPYFQRSNGSDHFIALGRGMWHFIYTETRRWGCSLLKEPEMKNVLVLTNDRDPWNTHVAGIPYPVSFHPSTDAQLRSWQEHVRQWPRRHMASFVGSTSRGTGFSFSSERFQFRGRLMDECNNWDGCIALDCQYKADGSIGPCHKAAGPMQAYMDTHFCLQPPGDTMPRKSIFDSMVGGCIPVFFHPSSAYSQYVWYLPLDPSSYSVFINYTDVAEGRVSIKEVLSRYTQEQIANMRNVVIDSIIPKIIVGNPENHKLSQDAVSIAVDRMLVRVRRQKAGLKHEIPNPYLLERWSRQELQRFMEEGR